MTRPSTRTSAEPRRAVRLGLRLAAAACAAAAVAACAPEPKISVTPPFYRNLGSPTAQVDAASSLEFINAYRRNNGLPPLAIDPALEQEARRKALLMAARDDVKAGLTPGRTLEYDLAQVGYVTPHAVENTSAGYRTFAEAFSGWRESGKHNANLLDPRVTRMGIATAYSPTSKYKVFWNLILAAPPSATPAAGS
jgi:uncharacterized protein YkwD